MYVSEKMYKRIVEKEKHRRYAADWEPCSTLSEPFPSQHDPRVQTHQDQSQHQDLGSMEAITFLLQRYRITMFHN